MSSAGTDGGYSATDSVGKSEYRKMTNALLVLEKYRLKYNFFGNQWAPWNGMKNTSKSLICVACFQNWSANVI